MPIEYLSISSADRDLNLYNSPSDCTIDFDKIDTVSSIKLKNAEIPHTRYAVSNDNNTFYFSEDLGSVVNFYHIRVSQASYTASELGTALTLSMLTPFAYNSDASPTNTYSFSTAGGFGKMALVSSGDVPYAAHLALETPTLNTIEILSSTTANITYFSSRPYLLMRGALLTLKLVPYADREIQVTNLWGHHGIVAMGDFSGIDTGLADTSTSTMVPYSGVRSVATIMGYADVDLNGGTPSPVIGIESPFGAETTNLATVMVTTDLPAFVSVGSTVRFENSPGFLNGLLLTVSKVRDDTHFLIDVDRRTLWAHMSGKIALESNPSVSYNVSSIVIYDMDNNVMTLTIELGEIHDLEVNEEVVFVDFTSMEMNEVVATVVSVPTTSSVRVRFAYPLNALFDDRTLVSLVNPTTGNNTAYLTQHRFDLSRGRRIILVRALVEGTEMGSIRIPALVGKKFFARIALSSGGDVVNFATSNDSITSRHIFEAPLQRFRSISFTFFNGDGTQYIFDGIDYSFLLELETIVTSKV